MCVSVCLCVCVCSCLRVFVGVSVCVSVRISRVLGMPQGVCGCFSFAWIVTCIACMHLVSLELQV